MVKSTLLTSLLFRTVLVGPAIGATEILMPTGRSNLTTFSSLSNNFGRRSNKDVASVPEPRSALLAAIGWLILVLRRIGLNGKSRRNAP